MTITMEDIERRLKTVEADLKEIISLLKSNPEYNRKGIPQQLQEMKIDVDALIMKEKIFHTKVITYAGVAATTVLVIEWIGDKIIDLLTGK